MNSPFLEDDHRSHNRRTQGDRDAYSQHREIVMRLVWNAIGSSRSDGPGPGILGRVAVLGAGNCNDIDLDALLARFNEVHLADLDPDALEFGCRSASRFHERLHRYAPFDVASPLLQGTFDESISAGSPVAVDRCDLVLSSNVLSQLVYSVHQAVQHRCVKLNSLDAVQAVRRGHLVTIETMLRPGGRAVITTDFVSSDTVPQLMNCDVSEWSPAGLNQLAIDLLRENNFFTGMNPAVVLQDILQFTGLSIVQQSAPWIWTVGPRRYLVAGLIVQRDVDPRVESSGNDLIGDAI